MELSHLAVDFRTKPNATRKPDQHADADPDRSSTGIGHRNGRWKYKGEWDAPETHLIANRMMPLLPAPCATSWMRNAATALQPRAPRASNSAAHG
jgi:hypothetical protein